MTYLLSNSCKDVRAIFHGPNMLLLLAWWLSPSVCPSTARPTLHPLFLPRPVHQLAGPSIPLLPIGYHVPTPTPTIPAEHRRQSSKAA